MANANDPANDFMTKSKIKEIILKYFNEELEDAKESFEQYRNFSNVDLTQHKLQTVIEILKLLGLINDGEEETLNEQIHNL